MVMMDGEWNSSDERIARVSVAPDGTAPAAPFTVGGDPGRWSLAYARSVGRAHLEAGRHAGRAVRGVACRPEHLELAVQPAARREGAMRGHGGARLAVARGRPDDLIAHDRR